MRDLFLLDPAIIYLNHGMAGACSQPVFETYQHWQLELERQPAEFLDRRAGQLMADARSELGKYLGCRADDVVYFPNPTTALNVVARSLKLKPGDEILSSDHEYGAMDRTWRFICTRRGAQYIQAQIPLPLDDQELVIDGLWEHVSAQTRAIFISHITSPTAMRFPVEALCARAREQGILTIIDGAHAPGQIDLDLTAIGADFYAGACHKWLCSPKGASFLYAHPDVQDLLEPLVVSWGWQAETPGSSQFVDHHEQQGTRDLAAFLSVPAAIDFQHQYNWSEVRQRCRDLGVDLRRQLLALLGSDPLTPEDEHWFSQMFAVQLPECDPYALQSRLLTEFQIEAVAYHWNDLPLLRISIQGYNNEDDCAALLRALKTCLVE